MRRLSTLPPEPGSVAPLTPVESGLEETDVAPTADNDAAGQPVTVQELDVASPASPGPIATAANPECIPASRLWLLAFLAVLLTAAVGIYFLAAPANLGGDNTTLDTRVLWGAIIDKAQNPDSPVTRRLAHVIGGAALLLLPLLLAIFARWSKSKLVLGLTSFLLVLVVAGQVWIGILLLYDTNVGSITHFNPRSAAPPAHVTNPLSGA
jgi:hypothetical protein